MKVQLFYTPGCEKCADSKEKLKALATDLVPGSVWSELNVLNKFDYWLKSAFSRFHQSQSTAKCSFRHCLRPDNCAAN